MSNTGEMVLHVDPWRGMSAYESAVKNGFKGTEQEWLASLKGEAGGVASVNGVAYDAEGDVQLYAGNVPISSEDERTVADVLTEADKLLDAVSVTGDALDVGGRYIDNALFR